MKLRLYLLASLCFLALSGCQNTSQKNVELSSSVSETAAELHTGAEEAIGAGTETASESSIDLIGLTDLVGKSDAEVTAVLGQGKEMKNSEGILLERDYTLPILGENADVSLSFNPYQEGAGLLEQAVINLGQADLDEYAQTLTQLFGEPTEKYEKSYFFVSGNKTLVLADPYDDGAYIEISVD